MTSDTEFTDYEIQALLDGSLDPAHEKQVKAYVANNSDAGERYRKLLHQKLMLKHWWAKKKKH